MIFDESALTTNTALVVHEVTEIQTCIAFENQLCTCTHKYIIKRQMYWFSRTAALGQCCHIEYLIAILKNGKDLIPACHIYIFQNFWPENQHF